MRRIVLNMLHFVTVGARIADILNLNYQKFITRFVIINFHFHLGSFSDFMVSWVTKTCSIYAHFRI